MVCLTVVLFAFQCCCDDYMVLLESAEAKWRLKFGFNAFECLLVHMTDFYQIDSQRSDQ
jgi:hypothetical protein